ncbi:hypothetical protein ACO0QE_004277 [Hanseniaspora vineae]
MSSSNKQNNNPISITKGYLSPTLSPSFFPLNVGDDSMMPFMSLDKSTNSAHNVNGNSAMVTTSLSKLGDITRGRGRQRSLSNTSFTGGETPLSMLTKRTISNTKEMRMTSSSSATQRKTSQRVNQLPAPEIPLQHQEFVSTHKDKDSMIEKFLDQGQKHPFITGNIADNMSGSSGRQREGKISVHSDDDNNEEDEDDDDDDDDDDIPIDFVEMVEQSGLLDNSIEDATPQELMSHAKRLRNTKNVHKHMKRYSHISAYSSVTTAVPAQMATQWEASMNERHQHGGHDGRVPYDRNHEPNCSSSPVKSQQEVTSETQLVNYSSSQYEMAERQLKELQQQQIDLKMQQLQLQIEELKLTNDRLRYAIDEKKQYPALNNGTGPQSNMSLGQSSMNEYEMSERVKLLESKIGDYEAVISQLTRASSMSYGGSSNKAQQHQISNHEHHSSGEPWVQYDSNQHSAHNSVSNNNNNNNNNNTLKDTDFDEAGSCTMSNCNSQLHVKKLRLSKIDSTQLEQLTRSRSNSKPTSQKGSPLKANFAERENRRHSKNIEHLEDFPFTTRNITGEDNDDLKLDQEIFSLNESGASNDKVNVLKDISNTANNAQPQSTPMSTMSSSHSDSQMSQWKQSMQAGSHYQHKHNNSISMESTCSNDTSVSRHSNKRSRAGYNLNLSIELKK